MTRLTLSFDNGPTPEITPHVLEALSKRGLKAYFFVLGKHVDTGEGRALVERMLAEGHRVGNHSYSHEVPLGDDPRGDAVEREIVSTERLLAPLLARVSSGAKLFRPFGGGGIVGPHLLNAAAERYLREAAYTCVLWNDVPHDWDDPEGWADRALAACTPGAHRLTVLHDIPGACLAHLERFLDEARARGIEFTLDLAESCLPLVGGVAREGLPAIVRS
ncbi:Chitooligosaccharide deacetylase [Labilithrix luteola]|uniref:Chitooligosaccharide deacetylase n=1 Tax=Labilithrix luteola TaxID=1391654 RepID=A0A0K1PLL5_9BACT|nr:polysaccharide deacetylase family protein [Labilithrix luteola]AKU94281.1 Chitooligosaccharide deacetylase [Labilithrix luteola]